MLLALLTAAIAAAPPLDGAIREAAALRGEPAIVSAAGLTKADAPILTIENAHAFDTSPSVHRAAIIGFGFGDERAAAAVVDVVRWFKTAAPANIRREWTIAALPDAAFDPADAAALTRWITFQAPDVIVQVRSDGGRFAIDGVESAVVQPSGAAAAVQKILGARREPSDLRRTIERRVARAPLDIARVLAPRYPETPAISYIPAVAWENTLRLAAVIGDSSLADKVRRQTSPWVSGERPLFGDRIQLTSVAGTIVFADLAALPGNARDPWPLAAEGARLAASRKDTGIASYGQGWTDDMFMAGVTAARAAVHPDERPKLDTVATMLVDYASRLQRPDGVFVHATDGPFAWGRGNGFAALGLTEVIAALPADHPRRAALLDAYRKQMAGLRAQQAPDGMWREVIDEPGAYREETATAMLLTAMSRGIRFGWLDASFRPIVERAWRGLAAHVGEDASVIDVCASTGVGPSRRYYLDRPAVTGGDDRGGAMALLASMEMYELSRR